MKELFEVSVAVKVSAANVVSKRVADPLVQVLEKSVPYFERVAEAFTKSLEVEVEKEAKKD